MSAAAAIPSLIPLCMVIAMRRAEARLHRQLEDARAWTAESAIVLAPTRGIDKRRLQGLVAGGAVRVAANGGHFLDADGWSHYQRRQRRRILLALSVVAALLGIGVGVAFALS